MRYAGWTSTKRKRFFKNPDGSFEPMSDEFGKYDQGTIFRMACFLRNKRVFINHPQDPEDKSALYRDRIRSYNLSDKLEPDRKEYLKNKENQMLRLHDHEGKWAKEYDSAFLSKVKFNEKDFIVTNPEFILKRSHQYSILSHHDLDMEKLDEKWDNSRTDYYIL